ncbi:MAG: PAS domain S-box protein [Anaerolineae bacterium]|nr:PAS domain S-box protein [Anaerolineae bacterium]
MSLNLFDFRIRQRDYLLSITRAMVSRLNIRAVLRLILQASVDMLQGESGLIALSNEGAPSRSGREFDFWASYGLPPALVDSFRPLVANVPNVDRIEDFAMPDLADKLGQIAEETGLLLRQVVALPMVAEQQLLGVIFIFRAHSSRFSPDDRQILSSFADYAAVAVNNARLYESAETERRRLDALLDASADGMMVLRPNLRIERFNRALVALTGWRADEAIDRHHGKVIDWTRRSSEMTLEDAVAQGWPTEEGALNGVGGALYVEGDLRRRNGSLVSLAITYAPLMSRSGQLLNIIGTVRDITRFRESDALKDTFISIVSHELKTPVAIIKGYAETLLNPRARGNPALVEEMLSDIIQESDRLARLVDDLLDASRLQAGGLPFRDVEEVDLRMIAQRVVERYAPRTNKHELVLAFPETFPTVQGDAQRLEQVLDNLVSNAIKYSPRGGEVEIAGRHDPAEIVVSVSDEGVGIPLDEQERIFDRFYRVEGPETRAVSGTGLGLYLTRAIVEAHGGRCWVSSAPGQGSTFYVALPRETGLAIWRDESLV